MEVGKFSLIESINEFLKANDEPPSTWAKILNSGDEDHKLKPWSWFILKSNMLLVSDSSVMILLSSIQILQRTACSAIICLDGCKIGTYLWKKPGKPLWKQSNSISLEHPDRNIFQDKKSFFLVFKTAHDLEHFYHLLNKTAVLTSEKVFHPNQWLFF